MRDQQAGGLESALGGWGGKDLAVQVETRCLARRPAPGRRARGRPRRGTPLPANRIHTDWDRRTEPAMAPAPRARSLPAGSVLPEGFLMPVSLRPLKPVRTQARSRLTAAATLHTCGRGRRLLVMIVLEVWPSPVPAAVCTSVSPVAGQDGGSRCVAHVVRGPGESPLLPVSPGPWPSSPSSFPANPPHPGSSPFL